MKKSKKKKKVLIFGVIFFFFILIYVLSSSNNYLKIEELTREIGFYLEKLFIIKRDDIDIDIIDGINKELEIEISELKDMLKLESSEYKFIHANVIKRDNNWYQTLTLDKGKKDGINLDMAVISSHGLIGRVIKTTNSSSVIKLLTASSNDMKVSVTVKTKDNEIYGILDDYLEDEQLIQINNISKNSSTLVGDKVYTSGLGGVYPGGIYIGEVVDISEGNLGLNKILKVKTDVNYDSIRFVSVIDRS